MLKIIFFFFFSSLLYASTLHLSLASNPAKLNPLIATDSASGEISSHIFNALFKYDKTGIKIIGDLAKNFYFENNTTLIVELKQNILWQDGAKFTAQDVLFTFETLQSKNLISPYSASFKFVKNVKILTPYKLKINYKTPYFKALEIWMLGIIPYHILHNEKNIMTSSFNTHPIGTGPYKLTKLQHSQNIILKANQSYFEKKPKIDKIIYHIIADPTTRFFMLKSHKIDIESLDAISYERKLSSTFQKYFNIYEHQTRSYTYLGFNLRRKKFQNPKVRKALSLALNRQELIDILFFHHAKIAKGPFLPGILKKELQNPIYNITQAKQLLLEAGYNAKNPLKFEIATSNSNAIRPYAAQIIQHQLQKIGVKVSLKIMEWQAFLNTIVFPHNFDTVLLGWGLSPAPDPYMFWHSKSDKLGGFNLVGYHNNKVDKLIEKSQNILQKKELNTIFEQISDIILEENPYLFLYIPNAITAVNKKINNIDATQNGIWYNYILWEKE